MWDWLFEFGRPENVRTDGGPQFRADFKHFCDEIGAGFTHSSPGNSRSNGLAESAVKTAKSLVLKCGTGRALREALVEQRNALREDEDDCEGFFQLSLPSRLLVERVTACQGSHLAKVPLSAASRWRNRRFLLPVPAWDTADIPDMPGGVPGAPVSIPAPLRRSNRQAGVLCPEKETHFFLLIDAELDVVIRQLCTNVTPVFTLRQSSQCKFYLQGLPDFVVLTDHKPLVGVFLKDLHAIENPPLQQMRERLTSYSFSVSWVPGKHQVITDALSHSPVFAPEPDFLHKDDAIPCLQATTDPALNIFL
eukprot:snap_masked-scaffold1662_size31869-processed-gene-0.1 protein:Tk07470 transcript:snap_masked-scaffold1662_size31869-processed-gene-0.1-mRNA-1 annotation:"hypothetical protein DAPPUDRAFT_252666"